MKRWLTWASPVLAVLVLALAFALVVRTAPPAAPHTLPTGRPSAEQAVAAEPSVTAAQPVVTPAVSQAVTGTANLPVVFNNYDSQYLVPFGYVTYADVSDELGRLEMQAAGSQWVTTLLYWEAIEPNPPDSNGVHTYNWAAYDALVQRAHDAGLSMFVLFTGNPAWAAQYDGGPVNDMADLVSFVTAAAERYDGDGGHPAINYWSFYSEPDNGDPGRADYQGKGFWGNDPNGYAALLAQLSPVIHTANPNANVLIGGLAYDFFTTEGGPYVRAFLGNVLARLNSNHGGATTVLDAVAFHYYPISTVRWPTIAHKAAEIQGIMDANGAGSLPLFVPEMAFWSGAAQNSTETMQAERLVQIYARGLSAGIRMMAWFSVFDNGLESHGLFRNEDLNDPKPAYDAYSVMTDELTGFYYQQPFTAPGAEGYIFRRGAEQTTVVWAAAAPVSADFAQECARVVGLLGNTVTITDGGAGDTDNANNGKIRLALAVNRPLYVTSCP